MASNKHSTCACSLGNDIVKQGYLSVKRPPRRYWNKLKAWHKRFIVLRDETRDRGPLLEMYFSHETVCSKFCQRVPQVSIDLAHTVHIGLSTDSSRHPHALIVVCQGRSPLLLAAEDELSARSWLLALGLMARKGSEHVLRMSYSRTVDSGCGHCGTCCDSSVQDTGGFLHEGSFDTGIYSADEPEFIGEVMSTMHVVRERFPVSVNPTEDSERLGLRDDVNLVVFNHGVGLAKTGEGECFLHWPVSVIRQYKHEAINRGSRSRTTLVTLEIGRRCSTGEGVYQFRTQQGQDIIQEIRRMVTLWSSRKSSSTLNNTGRQHLRNDHRSCCQHSPWLRGRSAPATPSFLSSRYFTATQNVCRKLSPETDDLNYIIPSFERSCDSAEEDQGLSPRRHKVPNSLAVVNPAVVSSEKWTKIMTPEKHSSDSETKDEDVQKTAENRDYIELLPSVSEETVLCLT